MSFETAFKNSYSFFLSCICCIINQAGEKKKYDDLTDLIGPIQFKTIQNGSLKVLRVELEKRYNEGRCDGYALYL